VPQRLAHILTFSAPAAARLITIRLLALGIVIAVGATGCSSNKNEAQLTSSSATPGSGIDLYIKGNQQLAQGQTDQAVSTLTDAIAANPNLITPRQTLGAIYRDREQYAMAADQYQTLTRLDPYDPQNYYDLGVCYQFLDRVRDSIAAYLSALKLNPADARTNMNLGLAYLYLDNAPEAVNYTQKATQLDPNSADAWANYGVALDAQGDFLKAENAYRRSLELDSNKAATMIDLGANLIAQNKTSGAIAILNQAIRRQDSPLAHKLLADALLLDKHYDDAIAQYQQALTLDPNYTSALNSMAGAMIAKYETGSQLDDSLRASAVSAWKKSLTARPQQPQIAALVQKWDRPAASSPSPK